MEEHSRHIDELFRNGLEDYREIPNAGVWDTLVQRLPANPKPDRFRRWWWLLLLVLITSLGYFIIGNIFPEKNKNHIDNRTISSTAQTIDTATVTTNREQQDSEHKTKKTGYSHVAQRRKVVQGSGNNSAPHRTNISNNGDNTARTGQNQTIQPVPAGLSLPGARPENQMPQDVVGIPAAAPAQVVADMPDKSVSAPGGTVATPAPSGVTPVNPALTQPEAAQAAPGMSDMPVAVPAERKAAPHVPAPAAKESLKAGSEEPGDAGKQVVTEPQADLLPESRERISGTPVSKYLQADTEEAESITRQQGKKPETGGSGGGVGGGADDPGFLKAKRGMRTFSGGIKAGYGHSLGLPATSSVTGTPFLEWNISERVALVLQPEFRYNRISTLELQSPGTFHRLTHQTRDSFHVYTMDTVGLFSVARNYTYSNTYDSIISGERIPAQHHWEVALPLLFRYAVSPSFFIHLGFSLSFSGTSLTVENRQQTISGLQKSDTISYAPVIITPFPIDSGYPNPPPPGIDGYFNYNTPEYSGVPPDGYKPPASNPARFGYMLGISYELRRRLVLELMVHQTISDMRYITNERVRQLYTSPQLRFMIGYRLFPPTRKRE